LCKSLGRVWRRMDRSTAIPYRQYLQFYPDTTLTMYFCIDLPLSIHIHTHSKDKLTQKKSIWSLCLMARILGSNLRFSHPILWNNSKPSTIGLMCWSLILTSFSLSYYRTASASVVAWISTLVVALLGDVLQPTLRLVQLRGGICAVAAYPAWVLSVQIQAWGYFLTRSASTNKLASWE